MLEIKRLFTTGLVVVCLFTSRSQAEVPIAREGKALAAIVAGGHEKPAEALELYLKGITGADIPVVPEIPAEERPLLILGVSDSIAGTSDTPKGSQSYRLHTEGARLYLTGRTELGLTYAVYGFLEDHLGVRFYSANSPDPQPILVASGIGALSTREGFEVVPKSENLTVGPIDDTQEPAFAFRGFLWNTDGKEHELKNRGGGFPETQSTHNFYHYISPEKYFDEHPEWFPLKDGKRTKDYKHQRNNMPFCYTNEELAGELAKGVLETMAKWADPAVPLPVGQGDGFSGCDCETCRRVVAEEGSEAGPVILLMNRVLGKTTKKFPDHKIITFAYFGTLPPPRNIRPHDNLWINITSSAVNAVEAGDQLGRIRNNPRNVDYAEALRGWPKIAPGRVLVWDWANHFFQPLMEWPNLLDVADNIRFFAESHVDVVRLQICLGNGNWGRLRRWLWLKMMWNPGQDPAELTQQYLNDNYGSRAGAILWEYIEYVHRVVDESGYRTSVCRVPSFTWSQGGLLFNADNLKHMEGLITSAEKAAAEESDPGFAKRMARVRPMTIDVLALPEVKDLKLAVGKDPRDGSKWLVPEGRPDMPARLDRVAAAFDGLSGGGGWSWFYRYLFLRDYGGPVARLENSQLACEVTARRDGQITSLVHRPTGEELVVINGHDDAVEGNVAQQWQVTQASPGQLDLEARLQFHSWEHYETMRLERRLELDGEAPRLMVRSKYRALEGPKRIPEALRFLSRWSFRVPKPDEATLQLTTGGKSESHSVASLSGEGEEKKKDFPLDASSEGYLKIVLDRGDGWTLKLSASAKGFDRLTVEPDPGKSSVTLLLSGVSRPMGQEEVEIDLPAVTLEVSAAARG